MSSESKMAKLYSAVFSQRSRKIAWDPTWLLPGCQIVRIEEATGATDTAASAKNTERENEAATETDSAVTLSFAADGNGLDFGFLKDTPEYRYLCMTLKAEEAHTVAFRIEVYTKDCPEERAFDFQSGVLPGVATTVVFDKQLMDGQVLFPEAAPGELKITCHGRRVKPDEIASVRFVTLPSDGPQRLTVSDMRLQNWYPDHFDLPEVKLLDQFGQWKGKEWHGKIHSESELRRELGKLIPDQDLRREKEALEDGAGECAAQTSEENDAGAYPFSDWSPYGGFQGNRLTSGSGYFSRCKKNGRWWMVDPEGYAFFSMGVDCTVPRSDCRIDGIEKWMDWLPEKSDPIYGPLYKTNMNWPPAGDSHRTCTLFSFQESNLIRAFGEDWYQPWKKLILGQLKKYGVNTLGNWSDPNLCGSARIPYVTSLERFPETKIKIFRDFPDVFSPEYEKDAADCAESLRQRRNDPWMIGYFLRNEPSWAFVDHLIIADEVLYNPIPSASRQWLISELKREYGDIESLNRAWDSSYRSFDDFAIPRAHTSAWSKRAEKDLRRLSGEMIRRYVEVPAKACRSVDPNHMILGMRWAWISDPALVQGWENFDVFSINCYAFDPSDAIQHIVDLGVDLPVMIGEFHFGALDAGPVSTGLKAVRTQAERGRAIRCYMERTAAHPAGVGCHYFQCYDQFALGRFDGENYNIGLFDICSQPYTEVLTEIRAGMREIYKIAAGDMACSLKKPEPFPPIAF